MHSVKRRRLIPAVQQADQLSSMLAVPVGSGEKYQGQGTRQLHQVLAFFPHYLRINKFIIEDLVGQWFDIIVIISRLSPLLDIGRSYQPSHLANPRSPLKTFYSFTPTVIGSSADMAGQTRVSSPDSYLKILWNSCEKLYGNRKHRVNPAHISKEINQFLISYIYALSKNQHSFLSTNLSQPTKTASSPLYSPWAFSGRRLVRLTGEAATVCGRPVNRRTAKTEVQVLLHCSSISLQRGSTAGFLKIFRQYQSIRC